MRLEHWTANTGDYRLSDRSEVADEVTPACGRPDRGGWCVRDPGAIAGLVRSVAAGGARASARPARVLQARIVAPDGLAVAEGDGDGQRRAWREIVVAAPWFVDGCDPGDFRDPTGRHPWLMAALLEELDIHLEVVEWLMAVEQYIG